MGDLKFHDGDVKISGITGDFGVEGKNENEKCLMEKKKAINTEM